MHVGWWNRILMPVLLCLLVRGTGLLMPVLLCLLVAQGY
jgi:hypothetical protein